jgi:hypothetical protein
LTRRGSGRPAAAVATDAAIIRPYVQTGFANGGWNLDRYKELGPLDPTIPCRSRT